MALVDCDFIRLIDEGKTFSSIYDLKKYVQPASLDLPLDTRCYIIKDKIVPFQRNIKDILDDIKLSEQTTSLLLKGQTYLCYFGYIKLPIGIKGKCSPKSSIGRLDVMVRTIFDQCGFYDEIPNGGSGNLWIQICPGSFNIKLDDPAILTQLMLFDETGIQKEPQKQTILHLDTLCGGYEALSTMEVINLSRMDNSSFLFFRQLEKGMVMTLEKDKFYIMATTEKIHILPSESAEMVPFSHEIGEFRAHKAGFFDPAFNATGVLEICPYETIRVCHGQPITVLKYFKNKSIPLMLYGQRNNHYQNQMGPTLSKYFS